MKVERESESESATWECRWDVEVKVKREGARDSESEGVGGIG